MNILVTGANGFIGRNLVESLKNIKLGKDKTRNIIIDEIFEYDVDTPKQKLDEFCAEADFVFNLAGVNRPKNESEFMSGNFGFASELLDTLKKHDNKCSIMLSSSIQASCAGRYENSAYGLSKRDGERLFFDYAEKNGVRAYVYRFPNVFGKWCKPNYNSTVATFCYNIANDLPIRVDNRDTQLELLYIDDLIVEMLNILENKEHRCDYDGSSLKESKNGKYCFAPVVHRVTLGEIVDLLKTFNNQPENLVIPEIPQNTFAKKLYSTFVSYLPKKKAVFTPITNINERGSFTELLKTANCGQISVNISKPGVTKGEHWHNSKWEFFIVVSGHALIQERKIGTDEIWEFEVSGDKIETVYMLPGFTHNIINLSETENLVTLMWANEIFDRENPDTFCEKVVDDK